MKAIDHYRAGEALLALSTADNPVTVADAQAHFMAAIAAVVLGDPDTKRAEPEPLPARDDWRPHHTERPHRGAYNPLAFDDDPPGLDRAVADRITDGLNQLKEEGE